jgi:hypothetical protein
MGTRLFVAATIAVTVAAWGTARPGFDVVEGAQAHIAEHAAPAQQPTMPEMTKRHQQMMADMKAGDAKLAALVNEMNAAAGDAKINAVAAVVNEMVRQQRAMHGHMAEMHQHMMGMGRGGMMR